MLPLAANYRAIGSLLACAAFIQPAIPGSIDIAKDNTSFQQVAQLNVQESKDPVAKNVLDRQFTEGVGLSDNDKLIWQKVQKSVVVLEENGQASGLAACIDTDGFFIADRSAVKEHFMSAKLPNGQVVSVKWVGIDALSGLVLLQADQLAPNTIPALPVMQNEPTQTTSVLAALISGPTRAELVHGDLVAQVAGMTAAVSMDEVHLIGSTKSLAGTLYFDSSGELAGILGAWLQADSVPSSFQVHPGFGFGGITINRQKAFANPIALGSETYGPQGLVIAYSPSAFLLREVINGFLSPDHTPRHPYFGATCVNASTQNLGVFGALIVKVNANSPAATSGLKKGDVILGLDGSTVDTQVDFVRHILHEEVGQKMEIQFMRDGKLGQIESTIGNLTALPNPSS